MITKQFLYEKINTEKEVIRKYKREILDIGEDISLNLKYNFFDWQTKALENFLVFESEKQDKETHLLFNMATWTWKTMIMASLILYYYKLGYRSFIFFVNQNNIVDKTENNFILKNHNKYLFTQNINIDWKNVNIRKVETFSNDSDDIEIKFTSIHKLHNDIYKVKENCVYLDDLLGRDIVMLADEAHHLNSDTKSWKNKEQDYLVEFEELNEKTSQDKIEKSWENTVINKILKRNWKTDRVNKNVLLEFTATLPKGEEVEKKYVDKIIYKFDLKEFLRAWYTKEINLVSSSFEKKERILQVLVLNWYRHKISLKYKINNFKGVVLFRSNKIESSKEDFEYFCEIINNLKETDFDFLKNLWDEIRVWKEVYEKWGSRIKDMMNYINDSKISWSEIIDFIKYNFKKDNCIITNSKDWTKTKEKTSEEQEKLLNSLEDKNNHITAIFTVFRLTEWWDVLNLFDIVKLYDTRSNVIDSSIIGKKVKVGPQTVSEVQLIGRWVRYFPFTYYSKDTINRVSTNKRKFDSDLNHELRILEELFYHSNNDSLYLSELKIELKNQELIETNKKIKQFKLKDSFKNENIDFLNSFKILKNEQIDNPNKRKTNLDKIKETFDFKYQISDVSYIEQEVNLNNDDEKDLTRWEIKRDELRTLDNIYFKDFDKHIILKAINEKSKKDNSVFKFEKLKEELKIDSTSDIIKDEFLWSFKITIILSKDKSFERITNKEKLQIVIKFLDKIEEELKRIQNPYLWTDFDFVSFKETFDIIKEKSILKTDFRNKIEEELKEKSWYILDSFNWTTEEENLIIFLNETMWNLEEKYEKVFLLKNEEVYKIYDFKSWVWFQPDFLLFLKENDKNLYYQIFIEPKGEHLIEKESEVIKNDFLNEITNKYWEKNVLINENIHYKLVWLPLYNHNVNHRKEFDDEFSKL